MNNVTFLINQLPEYKGTYSSIRKRQSIKDLMGDLSHKHKKNAKDCDRIAKYFWKGNALNTAKFLFDFCKHNIHYKEEDTDNQTVKSISGILTQGTGDCKHYAQFIVGICSALERMGYPIKAKYRFAVYDETPNADGVRSGHVFAVIMDRGRELWCDPVVNSFDQRFPVYKSHEDKIPPRMPLSEPVAKLGQVWDVNGFGNSATLSGSHNHALEHFFHRGHLHGHHHGGGHAHFFNRRPLGYGGGGGGSYVDYVDTPVPVYMDPDLLPVRTVSGITVTRDASGTLYQDNGALGWIDQAFTRDTIGKAKKKKKKHHGLHLKIKAPHLKIKLPHIKIQPGKLLKKIALAPSRNAFLLLLKMNAFHLASNIDNKILHNASAKSKLWSQWNKLGGNTNKLSTALNQGLKVWNAHHAAHKISGFNMLDSHLADGYDNESVGIAPLAIPAALAAAAPIIAKIKSLLESFGVGVPKKGDIDAADADAGNAHNKATHKKKHGGDTDDDHDSADIQDDGSVDHGGGITSKVTNNPDGSQTMSYDVKDPTADDDGGGDDDTDTKTITKTKTKTVTKSKHDDDDSGGDDDSSGGGGGIAEYWDKAKEFVSEHKTWFIVGGIGIAALIIVPKIIHAASGPKKRRR